MPPVVVLDACVLYPAAQRDLLMWLAAGGVIRAHWTNEIHEEWMRNVARDFNVPRRILERVRVLMDRAAGDALIQRYRLTKCPSACIYKRAHIIADRRTH
jgi:hypothetical protein